MIKFNAVKSCNLIKFIGIIPNLNNEVKSVMQTIKRVRGKIRLNSKRFKNFGIVLMWDLLGTFHRLI
jgi:hypothetical protein